jgi:hypothetical protein
MTGYLLKVAEAIQNHEKKSPIKAFLLAFLLFNKSLAFQCKLPKWTESVDGFFDF